MFALFVFDLIAIVGVDSIWVCCSICFDLVVYGECCCIGDLWFAMGLFWVCDLKIEYCFVVC